MRNGRMPIATGRTAQNRSPESAPALHPQRARRHRAGPADRGPTRRINRLDPELCRHVMTVRDNPNRERNHVIPRIDAGASSTAVPSPLEGRFESGLKSTTSVYRRRLSTRPRLFRPSPVPRDLISFSPESTTTSVPTPGCPAFVYADRLGCVRRAGRFTCGTSCYQGSTRTNRDRKVPSTVCVFPEPGVRARDEGSFNHRFGQASRERRPASTYFNILFFRGISYPFTDGPSPHPKAGAIDSPARARPPPSVTGHRPQRVFATSEPLPVLQPRPVPLVQPTDPTGHQGTPETCPAEHTL